MNKISIPFLWSFQENENGVRHATGGEEGMSKSTNEETNATLIEMTCGDSSYD